MTRRFKHLTDDESRKASEALAREVGGKSDPEVPALAVDPTKEGTEEAICEIRRLSKRQGCVCGDDLEITFRMVSVEGERVKHVLVAHHKDCPLVEGV